MISEDVLVRLKIIIAVSFLLSLSACQSKNAKKAICSNDYSDITGVWRTDDGSWQVTLDASGKVVSAYIQICAEELYPNRTTYSRMVDGSLASFNAGEFNSVFDKEKNFLEVSLEIKSFKMQNNSDHISGQMRVIFSGYLAKDKQLWYADRLELPDYGPDFPIDVNDIEPLPSRFSRVQKP